MTEYASNYQTSGVQEYTSEAIFRISLTRLGGPILNVAGFVDEYEEARDLERSRVLEVEVESDAEAAKLAKRIQRETSSSRFRLYDVDIASSQVYLYQKRLFRLAVVEAGGTRSRTEQLSSDTGKGSIGM